MKLEVGMNEFCIRVLLLMGIDVSLSQWSESSVQFSERSNQIFIPKFSLSIYHKTSLKPTGLYVTEPLFKTSAVSIARFLSLIGDYEIDLKP